MDDYGITYIHNFVNRYGLSGDDYLLTPNNHEVVFTCKLTQCSFNIAEIETRYDGKPYVKINYKDVGSFLGSYRLRIALHEFINE